MRLMNTRGPRTRRPRTRRPRTRRPRDEGSALMAVIAVMAVMVVITVTVTGVSFYSLGLTSATRAGVQSIAAAESGVNVAEVSLTQGACQAQYTRAMPAFTATVSYSLSTTGEAWVAGCPAAGVAAVRIRVLSTGTAVSAGVAGNTDGDATTVEAVFSYVPAVLPGVQPTGAAMYLYGGVVFKNNANLLVAESGRAAIQVKNGSMECANNTVIEGDVVVSNGNLNISGCAIEGNAWASGAATLGQVTGNLTSATVNVNAATLPSRVGGVYTKYLTSADIPAVPGWVDVGYVPGDWVDSAGVPYKVTPIGLNCTIDAARLAAAANGTKPVIINALALCPLGVKATGDVNLTNDVVIFAQKFDFINNVRFKSSTTAQHKLWFVTPDNVANNAPTCGLLQGDFSMKNGFTIAPTIDAMLYTPCRLEAMNTFEWRGQLYANGANDFKNNTRFESVALGLPGINLDTGTVTGGSAGSAAQMGDLTSLRDLLDAG
ncbi:hypothetical protein E3T55_07105 [Cryobacterium frigoriphilum]|uniref:Uncharacterized protein n=1 Tax=Cryobacterium frigoriphilum TaxID=1259150 RepID=A0A4R9A4C2_9MICO|nr:hypothetical protein [Cryobacterium frigoriphilum]TFD52048.1 hypothetical protein E3T55_07105 [Cryobacterium frigoriphilum]